MAKIDEKGREIVDPTPIEVPLRFRKNIGEAQRTKELIRTVLSDYVSKQGAESFEESLDFDCEDDPGDIDFGVSPSEVRVMHDEQLVEELRDARDPEKVAAHHRSLKNGGANRSRARTPGADPGRRDKSPSTGSEPGEEPMGGEDTDSGD